MNDQSPRDKFANFHKFKSATMTRGQTEVGCLWRVIASAIVMTMATNIIKNKTQEEVNMKILVNLARATMGRTCVPVITMDTTIIKMREDINMKI